MREAEAYLDRIPMWAQKKHSLEDIRDILGQFGNPDREMNIIHVAGTNGKGSVCAYITSILNRAGYRTATFISPHLIRVTERFLMDGKPAPEEEFLRTFREVRALAEQRTAGGSTPPSYFEFLFYMFMVMSARQKPDFVILETGLGGLLDTTNVVEHPVLTVITSVSMDHMQYLGDTIEKIAAQKAGIIKEGVPVVFDAVCGESTRVILERAERCRCPVYPVSPEDGRVVKRDKAGTRVAVSGEGEDRELELLIPSQADYQQINSLLAVRAAKVLNETGKAEIPLSAMEEGIRGSYWPGRMEEVLPGVYLDGAHNAGGIEALARTIVRLQQETGKPADLMFGVVSDKEYRRMIQELCSHVRLRSVTIARMDTDRSMDTEKLTEEFRKQLSCPVEGFETVKEAWDHFLAVKGEGPAFCAGSLYLVGQVKELLGKEA